MTQIEKLLKEMRAHPQAVRYAELIHLLEHHGVVIRSGKGSHRVAERDGELYTIADPGPGKYLNPKTVKHCLQAFDLWK
ncbi:MAG: type II toxin-antitoxin system HicA family toxin [Coriobacteriia bacterium]